MSGPLSGYTVVDTSSVVSGPLATMLLADQGADVIKVEAPGRGDLLRTEWYSRGGLTAMFANCNRGKRSIVVELSDPRGLEIVHELVRRADVFVENYRPGVAERLGLGDEALRAQNPELVYCSINGYGDSGPYRDRRAYDPVIQALTGYVSIQKNPEVPIPDLVRNAVADKACSFTAAQAITAALLVREKGGGGQTVRVPMVDAALAFFWPDGMMKHTFLGEGVREGPALYDRYRLTETADGHVVAWTGSDDEWHALFRAIGRPELCRDERFARGRGRAEHAEELAGIVYGECRRFGTEELLERMVAEDVPGGPLQELATLCENPQIAHNGLVSEHEHPQAGRLRQCGPAPRFSSTPAETAALAPLYGEHTDEILAELGYDAARVAELREAAVVG